MPLFWLRGGNQAVLSAVNAVLNVELYHNNVSLTQPVIRSKAVVVATHLMAISDTDNICTLRLIVVNEDHPTLTALAPLVSDLENKGTYPVARGPVFGSPARKIEVPPNQKLFLQIVKEVGTSATTVNEYHNLLLFIDR